MSLKKLTRPCLALALAAAASPLAAQIGTSGGYSKGVGTFPNFAIYKPSEVAPVDLADSPRIDRLVRDGRLYVSLADAIALALENNLDIAVARFTPLQADVDILRTRGGGIAQSAQTGVRARNEITFPYHSGFTYPGEDDRRRCNYTAFCGSTRSSG